MLFKTSIHLKSLTEILSDKVETHLFSCVDDLVVNGLSLDRFSTEGLKPTRQDVTQFIAAWFKHIGISAEECRDWMIEYCVDVLSPISSSSKSQIRHSTKSNIKYIFKSDVKFDCGCENNDFKAICKRDCPVYDEMSILYQERLAREANKSYEIERKESDYQIIVQPLLLRDQYKDQFEKGMKVVREKIKEGVARKDIVAFLNDKEYKTRTGKKWTYANLAIELKKKRG